MLNQQTTNSEDAWKSLVCEIHHDKQKELAVEESGANAALPTHPPGLDCAWSQPGALQTHCQQFIMFICV